MPSFRDSRFGRLLALLFALGLLAAACGDDDDGGDGGGAAAEGDGGGEDDVLQVAFVYVGPVGDAGWTKKHDDGRAALEEALGDQVETTFIENVAEGATSERVFEDLARQGNDLIFGTSFGYGDQMLAVAERFPDVVFEHATGYQVAENMGTYFGAAEEARYLSGIAAGAATQNGRIGYVAAFPIPEVLRGINAFTLGAQSVRPDVTVQVSWTSTWFGPDIEKSAAEALLDSGVDVIAQHQDTPAPGEAAAARGAKWSGYNDDMSQFAPDAWLTGPVWDWGPFYIETAESVIDGSWESDQYYGTMADGLVGLASFGPSVSQETQDLIEQTAEQIQSGEFQIFTGEIRDQAGEVVIAEGETATLEELLATDYLVQGVEGDIPAS
jgi:basic membrane protein A and related proteins